MVVNSIVRVMMIGMVIVAVGVGATIGPGVGMVESGPTGSGAGDGHGSHEMEVQISSSGHDITRLDEARISELAKKLTEEEARVILKDGTEQAFCGNLVDNKKEGVYLCRLCDLPLFSSGSKFTSGTGWPSFFQPVDKQHVEEIEDVSFGMRRVEIECHRCGGHLGHVFSDGPEPTGLRFCVNSVSLVFVEEGDELPEMARPIEMREAYFAGGCFWGIEDAFQQIDGVLGAFSGYQGGSVDNPTYQQVCSGKTGHAEAVKVVFDPTRVSYEELLGWFFKLHNPTQGNRQGPDVGTQYRSAIFASDDQQLKDARAFVAELAQSEKYRSRRITTEVRPMAPFYQAEEYHQDYHLKHGGSCALPQD